MANDKSKTAPMDDRPEAPVDPEVLAIEKRLMELSNMRDVLAEEAQQLGVERDRILARKKAEAQVADMTQVEREELLRQLEEANA